MKSASAPTMLWPSSSHSSPALVGKPSSGGPQWPYTTTPNSMPSRWAYQRGDSRFIDCLLAVAGNREYASRAAFGQLACGKEKRFESVRVYNLWRPHLRTGEFIHGHTDGNKPAYPGAHFHYTLRLPANRRSESADRFGYFHGHR